MAIETLTPQSSALSSQSSVDELLRLMQELQGEIDSMAHLERIKTHAVVARDLAALADVTSRQERVSSALEALEEHRRELVSALSPTPNPQPLTSNPQPLTIEQLADLLPEPASGALRAAAGELAESIARLRGLVQTNAQLLLWAADLARGAAQWLVGQDQNAPAYTRSGERERDAQLSVRTWRA